MGSTGWYAAVGAVVIGGAFFVDRWTTPKASAPLETKPARSAKIAVPTPQPELEEVEEAEALEEEVAEQEQLDIDYEVEAMRGHAPIEDPSEFAMVFTVDGTTYLRLSAGEQATAHGTRRLVSDGEVYAVVAPVATNAMPAKLRGWLGKTVLVDGTCSARVVGFAEVTRTSGEAGDTWDYEEDKPREAPEWTIDTILERNEVALTAKLDGCAGTWARDSSYSAATVIAKVDEPGLESAALADLLDGDHSDIEEMWKSSGMEGNWRDDADVVTATYKHPLTGERWVFAQARRYGGCGDPNFDLMAAYRVGEDGKLRRAADLDYGYDNIREVVDLDGDGQPELVLGDGNATTLADLASSRLDEIRVPYHHYGCGC